MDSSHANNPNRLRIGHHVPVPQQFAALDHEQVWPWFGPARDNLPSLICIRPTFVACPRCDARTLVNGGGDFTCQGCGKRFHVN